MTLALPTAIAELRRWPQWVIWRLDAREGKTTKIPLNPKTPGQRASSTDPKTWAPYEATLKPIEKGRADGAGFVFTATDEYAGIDLDHCVTDGVVHPKALEIVRRLDSYTEFSPSGTGLHILVRAAVNGKRNRTKNTPWEHDFEVYDRARFFTVTGRQLFGSPTTIESRQDELDAVIAELFPAPSANGNGHLLIPAPAPTSPDDDAALEEKIRKSKQGAKYDRLMAGDTGDYGEDDSSADMALCNILAWWLQGDVARIDAWFRRSGLYREKWEREDYRERTIAEGIASCNGSYYDSRPPKRQPPKYEGRREAEAGARDEVARLIGLEGDDRHVLGGRSWGRDLSAAVEVDISDGSMLRFDSLSSFTAPAKMNAAIAFQIGSYSKLTQAQIPELFANLRIICEAREALTLDRRAMDVGITFMQEIGPYPCDVPSGGSERWQGFLQLADIDPVKDAKESSKSIASQALALVDSRGTRYVRVSWFTAYCKAVSLPGAAEEIVRRMLSLGWGQQGTEGRIKATEPGGTKTLQWAFFTVPEGWEGQ